jgi:phage-related minor tail protein
MGEAGPEAILPLTKTSKGLGVSAKVEEHIGASAEEVEPKVVNVNMYIQAMDSSSFEDYMEQNAATVTGLVKRAFIEGDEDLIRLSNKG